MYDRVDREAEAMRQRFGGLPSALEAEDIWRRLWLEEAHNSTALEGNTLAKSEVEELLKTGRAVGSKHVREYLEVRGYADAAQWVYGQALSSDGWRGDALLSLAEVRETHRVAVAPVWEVAPPENALPDERPGHWRRHEIEPFKNGMAPPPFTTIQPAMAGWVERVNRLRGGTPMLIEQVAARHAEFEQVHPFLDGNGRTGRLLMNLMLVRLGYPPAIISIRDRPKYLTRLARADRGEPGPLGELVARAVLDNLVRFIYPAIAGDVRLIPLEALATGALTVPALRQAAARGRLRAVKDNHGAWRSTKRWVSDYAKSKYETLRVPRANSAHVYQATLSLEPMQTLVVTTTGGEHAPEGNS